MSGVERLDSLDDGSETAAAPAAAGDDTAAAAGGADTDDKDATQSTDEALLLLWGVEAATALNGQFEFDELCNAACIHTGLELISTFDDGDLTTLLTSFSLL